MFETVWRNASSGNVVTAGYTDSVDRNFKEIIGSDDRFLRANGIILESVRSLEKTSSDICSNSLLEKRFLGLI